MPQYSTQWNNFYNNFPSMASWNLKLLKSFTALLQGKQIVSRYFIIFSEHTSHSFPIDLKWMAE